MQSHRSTRTLLAFILIVSAIASSTQSFLQVAHAAPAPTVTVTSPGPTAIGKPAQFVVSFSNTGVTAPTTGYGPYLDLFMPRGADGDIAPPITSPVTPYLFNVTKSYVGPEDETATGPNFQHRYTLSTEIANGQAISNLVVTDRLPNTIAFIPGTITTNPAA